jgi:DNA-binding transcriptional LysR family regulator
VLPAGHLLSTSTELRLADVTAVPGLPLPRWPRVDGSYPEGPGPEVRNHEQLLQLIALGQTMAVLPESIAVQLREGHAAVPLVDAAKVTTVIAWPPQSTSRPLAALVRTAACR